MATHARLNGQQQKLLIQDQRALCLKCPGNFELSHWFLKYFLSFCNFSFALLLNKIHHLNYGRGIKPVAAKGPPFLCTTVHSDTHMRGMSGTLRTSGLFTWLISLAVCSLYFLSPHTQKQVKHFLSGHNASSPFNYFRISWLFLNHGPLVGPRSSTHRSSSLMGHRAWAPPSWLFPDCGHWSCQLCSELSSGCHFPLTARSLRAVTYLAIRS